MKNVTRISIIITIIS